MHGNIKMKDNTTIRIKKELRELLKKKKKFGRETYSEVIRRELRESKKYG